MVKAVPDDMHTVTPHLVCEGAAAAIEFYKNAFGAVECARLAGPNDKIMHALHVRDVGPDEMRQAMRNA